MIGTISTGDNGPNTKTWPCSDRSVRQLNKSTRIGSVNPSLDTCSTWGAPRDPGSIYLERCMYRARGDSP